MGHKCEHCGNTTEGEYVERPWGRWRVLHEVPGLKVKELTVDPGQSLSMQQHTKRAEYWIVSDGQARVELEHSAWCELNKHKSVALQVKEWHRLYNPYENQCRIVEIQYGESCDEEDIIRRTE